jgi:hypothetical protein
MHLIVVLTRLERILSSKIAVATSMEFRTVVYRILSYTFLINQLMQFFLLINPCSSK